MILNSENAKFLRSNGERLAGCVTSKEDLTALAMAADYQEAVSALEDILLHTEMYFDEEILFNMNEDNWKGLKSGLLLYTFNRVNKNTAKQQSTYANERPYSATAEA